jgi:hypothetical protein
VRCVVRESVKLLAPAQLVRDQGRQHGHRASDDQWIHVLDNFNRVREVEEVERLDGVTKLRSARLLAIVERIRQVVQSPPPVLSLAEEN